MKKPLTNQSFFLGADTFFALLDGIRMVYIAGPFGSGKTLISTLIGAQLYHDKKVARFAANYPVKGAADLSERVPAGCKYYSRYLDCWFVENELLPLEDTYCSLDESHLFADHWYTARDYVAALRKTNLYLGMPSIWP